MSVSLLEQVVTGEAPGLMPLTVDQYHQMIAQGILTDGEPVELVDGYLVWKDRSAVGRDPMSHDPRHAVTIRRLQRLDRLVEPHGYHLSVQLPVTLSGTDEPEPDIAVVEGAIDAFVDRHPGPGDLAALIEVSDSSLRFDQKSKQGRYAAARIPQYWIVNLPEYHVEVYDDPVPEEKRYARRTDFKPGQTLKLMLGTTASVEVGVSDVLPPL